jgi:hypothetical protein
VNRIKRSIALFATLLATILGSATASALASSPASASTSSPGGPAGASVMKDPHPGPPWVFSGYSFTSLGACEATGRAYVNSKKYEDYTCRYSGGVYRLYLLPWIIGCGCVAPPGEVVADRR